MDMTAFPSTATAGSAKSGPVNNNANIQKLRNLRLDTSDPSDAINGDVWLKQISATEYELKAQIDSAVISIFRIVKTGNKLKLVGNPDINLQQLVNARLEQLATIDIPAVGAGTESQIGWDSDLELPFWVGSAVRCYFDGYDLDDPPFDEIECEMNTNGLAGDAATPSTATRNGGFLLAATKKLNLVAERRIPDGYVAGADAYCEVEYILASAGESNNDLTNLDGELRAVAVGESVEKTSTALAAIADDIGTDITQYSIHRARLTLDAAELAAGDRISVELLRGTAGGAGEVGDIIVIGATILVPVIRSAKVDE